MANLSKTLSPKKAKVRVRVLASITAEENSQVNAPNPFTPHGSQSPDNNLGRVVTGDRKFQKLHFCIETALSRAWRARLSDFAVK
jgi:hypothetical protein